MLYAIAAYFSWGFFPVYWKLFPLVPAQEVMAHRIVWSGLLVTLILLWQKRGKELLLALKSPKILVTYITSAILISCNWFCYIWAVNHGHVLETSLGYFLIPLINILLGLVFFRERLSRAQWIALSFASLAVTLFTVSLGVLPWISIVLALTFSLYGLIRKMAPLDSLVGLGLETLMLSVPALFYLNHLVQAGSHSFLGFTPASLWLAGGGIVTSLPLFWFAKAVRLLPLSTMGFFQYIAPCLQFLFAVFVFHEDFSHTHLVTFLLIWVALGIFSWDLVRKMKS